MSNWRDIGTAPKDGGEILVWGGTFDYTGHTFPMPSKLTRVVTAYWNGECWVCGQGPAHDEYYFCEPTRWQPLPAPPAHEGDQ